jgi:acetyl-CoA carboxylase carboxyl transferase subunit alpha
MTRQEEAGRRAMRISAPEVAALGCVDEIIVPSRRVACIPTARRAQDCWAPCSKSTSPNSRRCPSIDLVAARQQKFRNIAQFYTEG